MKNLKFLAKYDIFSLYRLDKETAEKYSNEILYLLKNIPDSEYNISHVTAENKGNRILYGKWEHSLIIFYKNKPVGILIGYERKKEENSLYPENCFYINEISIDKDFQKYGLGSYLMKYFLNDVREYKYLKGKRIFKVQTTDSIENIKVINFYKKFGFLVVGRKKYPFKYDLVMELKN